MMWRRRKSVVNMRQQVWFGLELIVVAIGFVLICGFFLFIPPMSSLMGGEEIAESLLPELIRFIFMKWPVVMAAFAMLLVIGILMSHRLWGPLYGLERCLAAWKNGDRSARVFFRKYDYLFGARDLLNGFFDLEEERWKNVGRLAEEIRDEAAKTGGEALKTKTEELARLTKPRSGDQ